MERVVAAGVALRLILVTAFPALPQTLEGRVECSTALSAVVRLREGLYLLDRGQAPYGGGPVHQSPLLLALFRVLGSSDIILDVTFALADGLAAWSLAKLASRRKIAAFSPEAAAAVWLFNPFTLVSTLGRSTATISRALVVMAFGTTKPGLGTLILSLAAVLAWYPAYFLPFYVLHAAAGDVTLSTRLCCLFFGGVAAFLGLAYLSIDSWAFFQAQYMTLLGARDLTSPNIGLWWYFFVELFDHFRPFFKGAFQLFVASFMLPLSIRFHQQPLFGAAAMALLLSILTPYPEAGDVGLWISLLVLNKRVVQLLEYPLVVGLGFLYVSALAPAFHYLWIYVGSGNANFFYAITLAYALISILGLSDIVWAAIRVGYDGGKVPLAQI